MTPPFRPPTDTSPPAPMTDAEREVFDARVADVMVALLVRAIRAERGEIELVPAPYRQQESESR